MSYTNGGAALDTSFGNQGVTTIGDSLQTVNEILAVGQNTFIEVLHDNNTQIAKLDSTGNLDQSWGNKGYADVGFDFEIDKLIYNPWSKQIIAISTNTGSGFLGKFLSCKSFSSETGIINSQFGTAGLAVYDPAASHPVESGIDYAIDLQAVTALPHGKIAFSIFVEKIDSQGGSTGDGGSAGLTITNRSSGILILKGNGKRDTSFGKRGFATIDAGGASEQFDQFGSSSAGDRSSIKYTQIESDGDIRTLSVKIIARYDDSSTPGGYSASYYVLDRTMNSTGKITSSLSNDYLIIKKTNGSISYSINNCWFDKGIAEVELTSDSEVPVAFALQSGKRPSVIDIAKIPTDLHIRASNGSYFDLYQTADREFGYFIYIVGRYKKDGQKDLNWGTKGFSDGVKFTLNYGNPKHTFDSSGRLVLYVYNNIYRFNA